MVYMRLYIGIDDTDSPNKDLQEEKKGTGRIARETAKLLQTKFNFTILGVTRHQLPKHILKVKTNNSSKCIHAETDKSLDTTELVSFLTSELKKEIHPKSSTGIAILQGLASKEAVKLAREIQKDRVDMEDVYDLARGENITLTKVNGNGSGIIGAFAAVVLASTGNDGRFIERGSIRDIDGLLKVKDILKMGIDEIKDIDCGRIDENDLVISSKIRPALKDFKAVLYVRRRDDVWEPIIVD